MHLRIPRRISPQRKSHNPPGIRRCAWWSEAFACADYYSFLSLCYQVFCLRIAFVSDAVYPGHFGGLEVLEHAEAKELAKVHEVHFFSMQWPGMRRTFKQEGITYHASHRVTQEKFYRHGRRSIREALVFSFSMFRIFRYRFDVIISNEFPVLQIPILKLYCMLTGCR